MDRVLVQRAEAVTKTKGGIVIPEKSVAKVLKATVVAVGPGSRNSVSLIDLFYFSWGEVWIDCTSLLTKPLPLVLFHQSHATTINTLSAGEVFSPLTFTFSCS